MKLIHIGKINSSKSTYFFLILLRASTYAVGYAITRQTSVVTIASAKLYNRVPKVLVLEKNPMKFANENCPCAFVNA